MNRNAKTALIVILLALVSMSVRIHGLGRLSLWIDEGCTVWKIKQPYSDLFYLNRIDTVPPLYYYLLKTWALLIGEGDFQIRLFSALLGAITCVLTYFVGRILLNGRSGIAAALCVALSSFHIQYSQEARSYALVVLLFALNLYFITRIQQSPSPPLWIGYALSGVLLLYSHGLAIVYLAVLNAFFLSNPTALTRKMLATWALANVCILLAFSPWLLIYLKQVASFQHQTTIGKPGIAAILSTLVLLVSFPPPNASFLPGSLRSFGSTVLPLIQCAWVISAAFLFGLPLKNIKQRPFPILSLYLLCLLPFILIVTFSHLAQSLYLDRLFLICIVPLALLFGSNLSTAAPLPARLAVFLLCIYGIVSLFCLQTYYLRDWKEDYRSATEFLVANARPGDVVIFVAHVGELHFDWYSKGRRPDLIKMGLPEGIYERGEPEPGLFVKSSSDLTRLCHLSLREGQQIWLVQSHSYNFDPNGLTERWLSEHFESKNASSFPGVRIRVYSLNCTRK